MGAAGRAGARLFLAVTLCLAAAEPHERAAGKKVLPPPSNLQYSFDQLCKLIWTWSPPEGISSDCDLEYCSEILINGIPQDNTEWSRKLFREEHVSLSEEVCFKVRSECKAENASEPSDWVMISTSPKGAEGTAAVDINCTWHNLEYMVCTWLPGQNASAHTNYTLHYWHEGLGNQQQCQNYISGDTFGCNFSLSIPNTTSMYSPISILIRGNSEEIRPVCENRNPTTIDLEENCHADSNVDPNTMYTVKVRAKVQNKCYSSYHLGDWSEEKSIGENTDFTMYIVLMLAIPLTVALATIILLVYLKRLKILIYPQIPDPRKIIKRMFGEQIEDLQGFPGDDFLNACKPAKEEEILSLVCIETLESFTSAEEERERPALQVKAL